MKTTAPPHPLAQTIALALSIDQAAEALGVSRDTVYGALTSGELTARKLGRRTLIELAELERWLATRPVAQFGSGRRFGR